MKKTNFIFISFLLLVLSSLNVAAQKIIYSEPDNDDNRGMSFEIIGRFNSNYLIYKSYRDNHYISIYDAQMKVVGKSKLDFLPDKVLNTDFLVYQDFSYMFYQYQKRSILYSMAVKLDSKGKKIDEPIQLDTTSISFLASNRIYAVINSEDKQKILVYKVNNRNDKFHIVTTLLYNKNLELIHKASAEIAMPERNDFLSNFQVDNNGDMVFLRASGSAQNDNINKLTMYTKPALVDNLSFHDIQLNSINLDDITLKVDNYNSRYLITSFYSKQRRGNVDGLFTHVWDKNRNTALMTSTAVFSDELRAEAKGENSNKTAFNDYFLKNVICKQDGGFVVIAEAVYTSSRGGINNSRWDYLNSSPYWGSSNNGFYSYGSGYGYSYGNPWNRYGSYNSYNNITRYFADNIAIISYDSSAKIEWTNIISKSQYDDNTDELIGYGTANTGENIHFLFNVQEKRNQILTDQFISADGQVTRNPTLKNLDKGYDFMPRHAKQVGAKQIIIPCQYRNYICFAKIEFN
jgi:hypothetical protein